jgi:hypothetical protein
MKMARDYYAEAKEVALLLEREGFAEEGQSLVRAISDGSTGTEILMAIRSRLERIDSPKVKLTSETRARVRELRHAIAGAL